VSSGLTLGSFTPEVSANDSRGTNPGLLSFDSGPEPDGGHPNDPYSSSAGNPGDEGGQSGAGTGLPDPVPGRGLDQSALGDGSVSQPPGDSTGNGANGGNSTNPPPANQPVEPSATVPEPSALLLLSIGVGLTLRRWKRLGTNHHTC
jgi:hypothetical protein